MLLQVRRGGRQASVTIEPFHSLQLPVPQQQQQQQQQPQRSQQQQQQQRSQQQQQQQQPLRLESLLGTFFQGESLEGVRTASSGGSTVRAQKQNSIEGSYRH